MSASGTTFSVRLPDETRMMIDELAAKTQRSRSFIVNEAVDHYLHDRLRYLRELDAAVESVKRGPNHSGESVFKWMISLGTDNPLPRPLPDTDAPTE